MPNLTNSLLYQFILNEILRALKNMDSEKPYLTDDPHSSWNFNTRPLNRLHTYLSALEGGERFLKTIEEMITKYPLECVVSRDFVLELSTYIFDKIETPDENLLLFLLRKGKSFDALHGKHFLARKVKSLFPKNDCESWMCLKFEERGFSELVPMIRQQIAKIEHAT